MEIAAYQRPERTCCRKPHRFQQGKCDPKDRLVPLVQTDEDYFRLLKQYRKAGKSFAQCGACHHEH